LSDEVGHGQLVAAGDLKLDRCSLGHLIAFVGGAEHCAFGADGIDLGDRHFEPCTFEVAAGIIDGLSSDDGYSDAFGSGGYCDSHSTSLGDVGTRCWCLLDNAAGGDTVRWCLFHRVVEHESGFLEQPRGLLRVFPCEVRDVGLFFSGGNGERDLGAFGHLRSHRWARVNNVPFFDVGTRRFSRFHLEPGVFEFRDRVVLGEVPNIGDAYLVVVIRVDVGKAAARDVVVVVGPCDGAADSEDGEDDECPDDP